MRKLCVDYEKFRSGPVVDSRRYKLLKAIIQTGARIGIHPNTVQGIYDLIHEPQLSNITPDAISYLMKNHRAIFGDKLELDADEYARCLPSLEREIKRMENRMAATIRTK